MRRSRPACRRPKKLSSRSASFVSTQILDRDGRLLYEIMIPMRAAHRSPLRRDCARPDKRNRRHRGRPVLAACRSRSPRHRPSRGTEHPEMALPRERAPSSATGQAGAAFPQKSVLNRPEPKNTRGGAGHGGQQAATASRNPSDVSQRDQLMGLAYGIEAASETYFGKKAGELTLAEASLLADCHKLLHMDPIQLGGSQAPPGGSAGPDGGTGLHHRRRGGGRQAQELVLQPLQLT